MFNLIPPPSILSNDDKSILLNFVSTIKTEYFDFSVQLSAHGNDNTFDGSEPITFRLERNGNVDSSNNSIVSDPRISSIVLSAFNCSLDSIMTVIV